MRRYSKNARIEKINAGEDSNFLAFFLILVIVQSSRIDRNGGLLKIYLSKIMPL